jgi:serine/threonine-protein kinase
VAPTLVVRRWSGRADAPSAVALAQSTGARLAVFGQVLGSGGDSVRVNATLYDVGAGRALAEFQVHDLSDRIDRVADSLTVALLRELGRTRPIGAVRLASLGSASLPALKAFLQGEQLYRRTAWDSAIASYQRAIDTDSTFAPALRRVGLAMGWQRSGFDSLSRAYHLRAGAFNRGLAPRDSLLIAADSLSASLYGSPYGLEHWARMRRLFNTLDEATRRYPADPEVWYALGDARYHFGVGPHLGVDERQILEAFDRAIALDSAFGPSYIHPVSLGLALDGPAGAERYSRPYLSLAPRDVDAQGIRLATQLVGPERDNRRRQRLLDTASLEALHHAALTITAWPDSDEAGVALLRVLRDRVPPADSAKARDMLAHQLLYRGHLREAVRVATPGARTVFAEAALLGAVPADSTSRALARWLQRDTLFTSESARWWASTADTAMLVRAVVIADAMAQGELVGRPFGGTSKSGVRDAGRYAGRALRAYLDLARGDSARALAGFRALPDTLCHTCALDRLTLAQLLAGRTRYAEAAAILDGHRVRTHSTLQGGLWALERARTHEHLGDRARARDDYRFVVEVWRHSDPELRPFVAEAQAALQRLGHEPQP